MNEDVSPLLASLYDVVSFTSSGRLWYCSIPDCQGDPHVGAHWCDHPIESDQHIGDCRHARADQRPPGDDWLVWAIIAGRGSGKTRAAAEWITDQVKYHNDYASKFRVALIGRTPGDVRDVMIEGDSGLLAVGERLGFRPEWQPTKRRLVWPNGAQGFSYSAEVGDQLRGPQHHIAWVDEPAAWTDAIKGDRMDTAWNNLMLGLRLGQKPQCIFTTTPKPVKLLRDVLAKPTTVRTNASTYVNLKNLAPTFRDEVLNAYEGTRIGRQELNGEMLEDIDGALWSIGQIEACRIERHPDLVSVVVAVDPAGGGRKENDETGVVVVGKDIDNRGYVLADKSGKYSPQTMARVVIAAYEQYQADRIVAETNFGADMVENTLRAEDYLGRFEAVRASRGKRQRAEPIAALYGDAANPDTWPNRMFHVGSFAKLEDEMTTWMPESGLSPGRMDALVWAVHSLGLRTTQGMAFLKLMKSQIENRGIADRHKSSRMRACQHFYRQNGTCMHCGQDRIRATS